MESSSSSDLSSFLLHEKIGDLECKLSHALKSLKCKEHVLKVQQDQIKTLEDMYRKCLEDNAHISGEHKKILNEMENLRIILKSYEKRQREYKEFGLQVDNIDPLINSQSLQVSNFRNQEQFMELSNLFGLQNDKLDHLIEVLNHISYTQLGIIEKHIEDIKSHTDDPYMKHTRSTSKLTTIQKIPHLSTLVETEEIERVERYEPLTNSDFRIQVGCQTIGQFIDSYTSMKKHSLDTGIQSVVYLINIGCSPMNTLFVQKQTQCILTSYSSTSTQNTVYDEIVYVKQALDSLQTEAEQQDQLLVHFEAVLNGCKELSALLTQRNEEILHLRTNEHILQTVIEKGTILTINQVKQLCHDVTLCAGDQYGKIMHENCNLKESNEMLQNEIEDLKSHQSSCPMVVLELRNESSQTDSNDLDSNERSVQLKECEELIKSLQSRNDALRKNSSTLEEVKNIFVTVSSETKQFYEEKFTEKKVLHQKEIEALELKIKTIEEALNERNCIGEHAKEKVEILKSENEYLIKLVSQLREDLNFAKVNQGVLVKLRAMCLQLGQDATEHESTIQENFRLKRNISELLFFNSETRLTCSTKDHLMEIQNLQNNLQSLRKDNKYLSEGVDQLRSLLNVSFFESQQEHDQEYYSSTIPTDTEYESLSSRELVDNNTQSSLQSINIHYDKQIKILCKQIAAHLEPRDDLEDRLSLLVTLEKNLQILMKDFGDFKWSSQNEHQQLLTKYTELLAHNEELICCLNQYKNVNENLLQGHYELEKSKIESANEHQELLKDFLKLKEELNSKTIKKSNVDATENTILKGKDITDAEFIKIESIETQKINTKLKQEVENLMTQLDDQHAACLKHLQDKVDNKVCVQCDNALKALQTLNIEYKKSMAENAELKAVIQCSRQESNELFSLRNMNNQYQEQIKQLNGNVDTLKQKLQSLYTEKIALRKELDAIQGQSKQMNETIREKDSQKTELEGELEKSKDEIDLLKTSIFKLNSITEKYKILEDEATSLRACLTQNEIILKCNNALQKQVEELQNQLEHVTTIREKLETEFNNYAKNAKSNNIAQINELSETKEENEKLRIEIKNLKTINTTSKLEFARVADECEICKAQLESVLKQKEKLIKEHKNSVDELKRLQQDEIANLRRTLDMQIAELDTFQINDIKDENDMQQLRAFISAKELEIDHLMGQKLRAMGAIAMVVSKCEDSRTHKDKSQTVREMPSEGFKIQVNMKKTSRDTSLGRQSRHSHQVLQQRSASIPRMNKTPKKYIDNDPTKFLSRRVPSQSKKK